MIDGDRTLPAVLEQAHRYWLAEFQHWHDFEPDDMSGVTVPAGWPGFWIRQPDAGVEDQPIVFLGSEGEIAVIAQNLGDYLWLLAGGVGPLEPIHGSEGDPKPIPILITLAQQYTGIAERPVEAVLATARTRVPELTAFIESVCRYAD
ncbi:hypothetical protein J2S43_003480 [Catenuloplanes nepalensis]|uniref:SMI1/KNR4 family protein n=1 Tax=Catenuloplanes nepalensis TaxID=587533 RepID=A0ABT9MUA4_9ACTN|nr:hypothetical protein [Catenuloplanes nepalensis]MDP9794968.1 hypothetical protein [Catenuloplanes nepalensis]